MRIILFFILSLNFNFSFSQFEIAPQRSVCILELSVRNGENISFVHSVDHMLRVWGVPYVKCFSMDSATKFGMIVASSPIFSGSITSSDIELLKTYVNNGGIFVAGSYNGYSASLNQLFSITNNAASKNDLKRVGFIKDTSDPLFRWIDDPNEDSISIGNDSTTIPTKSYELINAVPLAKFDDGSNAIIVNHYGQGYAYALGFTFRDMIAAAQMDLDPHAERKFSNIFEPSGDAVMLFVKAIYTKHFPYSVWKHTIPDKRKGALILTHDMDSQTAMDLVTLYSTYEYSKSIVATYNITARYFHDYLMGPFFLPAQNIFKLDSARIYCNHVLANHSVGHFPDMENETLFPVGIRGSYNSSNYIPHYDGISTTGGFLYGETEVSKNLIESAFPIKVRTWRSGYLAFPRYLNNLLDTLEYDFNSTNSANDVLTNFPYRGRISKKNSGEYTRILEIPMTISDVFNDISETNYENYVTGWKDVTLKAANNYAPSILLIHPNRTYKLDALKSLVNQLPMEELDLNGMENYGDFWNYRDSINFYSNYSNNSVKIIIPASELPIRRKAGFVIDNGQLLDPQKIVVLDENGNDVPHIKYNWYESGLYIMFEPASVWTDGEPLNIVKHYADEKEFNIIDIYPNPFSQELKLNYYSVKNAEMTIELYDHIGKLILTKQLEILTGKNSLHISEFSGLENGMYFINISSQNSTYSHKIIKE